MADLKTTIRCIKVLSETDENNVVTKTAVFKIMGIPVQQQVPVGVPVVASANTTQTDVIAAPQVKLPIGNVFNMDNSADFYTSGTNYIITISQA